MVFRRKREKATARLSFSLLLFISILWPVSLPAAQKLTVAVAANFILPFKDMVPVFEHKTSILLEPVFTSTGNLYAQIKNGAPYDLFLAADEIRPALLYKDGFAEKPIIYAKGKVVLWTSKEALCHAGTWQEAVLSSLVVRIAITNPVTAPYGSAAVEALKRKGLWEVIKPRLVYAQNVAQVFQYAHTQSVDAGFCALSSTLSEQGKKGCYFVVEDAPAIIQAACMIKKSGRKMAVQRFMSFLASAEAEAIKKKYGYE